MAQFDVYPVGTMPFGTGIAYLLDIQSDFLDHLSTRIVAPLAYRSYIALPMTRLNPIFHIDGEELVMVTDEIASIPSRALGKSSGNLSSERDAIIAAVDFITQGF